MTRHRTAESHDNVANGHRPLPSIGARCRLLAAVGLLMAVAAVPALADDTGTIGGPGGDRFRLRCPADYSLVGLTGRAGDVMDQVAPVCARVDDSDRWTSRLSSGQQATGGSGGSPFTTMCPQDFVVVGFSGYAGEFVFNISISCRHRGPKGAEFRTGAPARVGGALDIGSTAGFFCPANYTAYGIVGRSGGYVDRFGLACAGPEIDIGRPVPAPPRPSSDYASGSLKTTGPAAVLTRWSSRTFPPPNGGLLVFTIMPDGNPACASYNGANCLWGLTLAQIDQTRLKPLVCGEAHRARWGATGFDDPRHWCSLARRNP